MALTWTRCSARWRRSGGRTRRATVHQQLGFVCAAFDLLLRSNEEGNKRGWIEVGFFGGSHRETDLAGRLTPALVIVTWSASKWDMCQQAREEETERRNERKEGREESRGGIQIEKEKKNPLLCLSPSYQLSLARGGGEDGRNGGESSLLNAQEAEDCKWLLARNDWRYSGQPAWASFRDAGQTVIFTLHLEGLSKHQARS